MHFSLTNDQKVTIAELASTTITDACDLFVRMEFINDDSSDIANPRFTVEEKVGIQLEFLSKMPGTYWHNQLIAAIEQQQDDYKFVLDDVLIENDNSAPMAPYWDDYKLKIVIAYLSKFIKAIGFNWDLLKSKPS